MQWVTTLIGNKPDTCIQRVGAQVCTWIGCKWTLMHSLWRCHWLWPWFLFITSSYNYTVTILSCCYDLASIAGTTRFSEMHTIHVAIIIIISVVKFEIPTSHIMPCWMGSTWVIFMIACSHCELQMNPHAPSLVTPLTVTMVSVYISLVYTVTIPSCCYDLASIAGTTRFSENAHNTCSYYYY